VKSLPFQSN